MRFFFQGEGLAKFLHYYFCQQKNLIHSSVCLFIRHPLLLDLYLAKERLNAAMARGIPSLHVERGKNESPGGVIINQSRWIPC